jgi:hypothetical protein
LKGGAEGIELKEKCRSNPETKKARKYKENSLFDVLEW